ncbi:hypothetical protein MCEMSEM18_00316 [Comamonadaceae bacterium]
MALHSQVLRELLKGKLFRKGALVSMRLAALVRPQAAHLVPLVAPLLEERGETI